MCVCVWSCQWICVCVRACICARVSVCVHVRVRLCVFKPHLYVSLSSCVSVSPHLCVIDCSCRQETGPPYQVYVVEAILGRRRWTVEKRLVDFCDLAQELQKHISCSLLPRPPKRPSLFSQEDVASTKSELDMYVRSLAGHVFAFDAHQRGESQLFSACAICVLN